MTQAMLENTKTVEPGNPLTKTLTPLLLDAVVPTASYYLLSKGFGLSTIAALGWSSVIPAARTIWSFATERRFNALAVLVLATNVVGLVLSLVAGDPRLMMAKEGAASSMVGLAVLGSVFFGKPQMSAALKPWLVKGDAAKSAAWDRLVAGSAPFRRAERLYSGIWGAALLTECVTRVVCVYTLPIDTMAWFGTVILAGAFAVAIAFGGQAVQPMERLLAAETARG